MKYDDISDGELFSLISENNEDAKDIIYMRYKYIIDIVIKKYAFVAMRLGFEYKDLYQEALVGFSDAINSYREDKNSSVATFITLCVDRKLQNAIKKASRIKNKILLESLSLEHVYEQYQVPLKDIISDDSSHDPLVNITKDEEIEELVAMINESLSDNELEVYKLLITGMNYNEIAKLLHKSSKQIDNAIQRIKNKVKLIIKNRENY